LWTGFGSDIAIAVAGSIGVLVCSFAAEFLDLGEHFAEENPDAWHAGDIDRNTGFAEVPVGINVLERGLAMNTRRNRQAYTNQGRYQAVDGTKNGGHDDENTHAEHNTQGQLLFVVQASLENRGYTNAQDEDVGGDVEDSVANLVVLISRALNIGHWYCPVLRDRSANRKKRNFVTEKSAHNPDRQSVQKLALRRSVAGSHQQRRASLQRYAHMILEYSTNIAAFILHTVSSIACSVTNTHLLPVTR
jgi:hypothetical protein